MLYIVHIIRNLTYLCQADGTETHCKSFITLRVESPNSNLS